MKIAIIPVTPFQQNCSLVWSTKTGKGAVVDPGGEVDRLLGTWDHVPGLLGLHALPVRVVLRGPDPVDPALPVAEEHLAQVGLDDRFQAGGLGERRSGLRGALEAGDVDRGQGQPGQASGDQQRLLLAHRVQRRVAVPAHQGLRLTLAQGSGLSVAHQVDVRGACGELEAFLAELLGHEVPLLAALRPAIRPNTNALVIEFPLPT